MGELTAPVDAIETPMVVVVRVEQYDFRDYPEGGHLRYSLVKVLPERWVESCEIPL